MKLYCKTDYYYNSNILFHRGRSYKYFISAGNNKDSIPYIKVFYTEDSWVCWHDLNKTWEYFIPLKELRKKKLEEINENCM